LSRYFNLRSVRLVRENKMGASLGKLVRGHEAGRLEQQLRVRPVGHSILIVDPASLETVAVIPA
jgi:hypothetical protein